MKEHFNGRKLLVLGGKPAGTADIVNYARAMGAYVIVTDYLSEEASPAKRLADESWSVSTGDVDILVDLARINGVDAVVTGKNEFNISKTIELADKLKLPFYNSKYAWEICSNKDQFKKLCMDFGIPVTKAYEDFNIKKFRDSDKLVYPVIVKPVDSSGGRGIAICHNADELEKSYEKALIFSKTKQVLIEKYISAQEVAIYYTAQDGEIMLSMMADREVRHFRKGLMPLPVSFSFPSRYLDIYMSTMDQQVQLMFKSIGIRNGTFLIQSFCDGNSFTFYEMGLRIGGALQYKIMHKMNGLNPMEMIVNYSMSGKMYDCPLKDLINPKYVTKAAILNFSVGVGEIGEIIGLDEVKSLEGVFDVLIIDRESPIIQEEDLGTLKQIVLRIYIMADTDEQLQALSNKIHDMITIYATNEQNMRL